MGTHYSVHPRYTSGSGAQVDSLTAMRVADQEREAYGHNLAGVYGEDARLRAERMGIKGVAEMLTETRKGWKVVDLCTGDITERPFATAEPSKPARRTIQQLAREACDVQDACNLVAVVKGFDRAMDCLRNDHDLHGDALRAHPVTRAWADKIASLAGVQGISDGALRAHGDCEKLAKGEPT